MVLKSMNKSNAQRFLELELGYIVNHGLHTFDVFVDGEGGVVVVFQVDKENRADVFGDYKIDGVLPIDIEGQMVVVIAFYIIVKGVE